MTTGISVQRSPLRVFYHHVPGSANRLEAGFSVTRNIRKASSRNFVKRRLRESFKSNLHVLSPLEGLKGSLKLVVLYTEKTDNVRKDVKHEPIHAAMNAAFSLIKKQLVSKK